MKKFNIPFGQPTIDNKEIDSTVKVLGQPKLVHGKVVEKFEKKFSEFCNTKYTIGCGNGTDAIFFALKSLNLKKKSEVLLPAQTYCSTIFSVIRADLTPVRKSPSRLCKSSTAE